MFKKSRLKPIHHSRVSAPIAKDPQENTKKTTQFD